MPMGSPTQWLGESWYCFEKLWETGIYVGFTHIFSELHGLTNKTGDSTIKKADWGLEPSKNQNLT